MAPGRTKAGRKHGRLARRYAHALYDLATELGCVDEVLLDMASIGCALDESRRLVQFLSDCSVHRRARAAILESLFRKGTGPLVWRFLLFLESKRRMALLPEACYALACLDETAKGLVRVDLVTAFAMEKDDISAISARIQETLPGPITVSSSVDPDLIGGFRYRVGDMVCDHSLGGALAQLKAAFFPERSGRRATEHWIAAAGHIREQRNAN